MIESGENRALALRGLVKQFGGVRALDGANLEVRRATIHGLVGQNGAGKSTLIKILAGIHQPDSGTIEIDGQRYGHLTPDKVERLGIHFIHQERLLVPTFTVGEALFLANEPVRGPFALLDHRRLKNQSREILRSYFDIEIPGEALISELTPAEQQIVQITRALLHNPSVLVFDEPTAALVKREADHLFQTVRRLRDDGLTIVYISHYLSEIELLCDCVTVLRNGADVGTVDPRAVPAASIASMMVARDIDEMFPKKEISIGESILSVRELSLRRVFMGVSFEVRKGEILGITGLLGSGMKELVRCLFGLLRPDTGQILIDGQPARLRTPFAAIRRNLALVPEDRREHGVSLGMSVRENVTLASLQKYSRCGLLQAAREKESVDSLIQQLMIQTPDCEMTARNLSGGNQQKIVLAKWLSCQSAVYLLDEPTVGVDVGAKVEIYRLIGALAEQGSGILLLSTDLLELSGVCDRILVMYRGHITREFIGAETDADEILASTTGAAVGSQTMH
jgi:ribose transport system ATP-binding protein